MMGLRKSICEDCIHSDLMDWEQDTKTGKATAIYWCEKNKKVCATNMCDYYVSCDFDDLEEVEE